MANTVKTSIAHETTNIQMYPYICKIGCWIFQCMCASKHGIVLDKHKQKRIGNKQKTEVGNRKVKKLKSEQQRQTHVSIQSTKWSETSVDQSRSKHCIHLGAHER